MTLTRFEIVQVDDHLTSNSGLAPMAFTTPLRSDQMGPTVLSELSVPASVSAHI